MKSNILTIAMCILVGLVAGAQPHTGGQPAHEKAIAENREFDRQILQAFEERSAEKILSFHWKSPDLVVVGPGGDLARGWEMLKPVEERFYASLETADAEIVDDVKVPSGDGVWSVLTVKFKGRMKDGTTVEATSRLIDLRRRINGRWVIVFHHNHELPQGPPPAQ